MHWNNNITNLYKIKSPLIKKFVLYFLKKFYWINFIL